MGWLATVSLFVVLDQSILQFQAQCNLSSPTQRATLNRNHSKMDSIQVQDELLMICLQMPIPESEKCRYHASSVCVSFSDLKYKKMSVVTMKTMHQHLRVILNEKLIIVM